MAAKRVVARTCTEVEYKDLYRSGVQGPVQNWSTRTCTEAWQEVMKGWEGDQNRKAEEQSST